MGVPAIASVVTVPFPFSDLSAAKLRPAVVLAAAGKGDWILCMVTSNPYSDPTAIEIDAGDFASGRLMKVSYARPSRLFTANESVIASEEGKLKPDSFRRIQDAVVTLIRP